MSEITPIFSTLADDPDLSELVELYVEEMPDRVSQIRETLDDKQELLRLIHQVKGAAGSYGFEELSAEAGRHENEIKQTDDPSEIEKSVDNFIFQCERVTTGTP